MRGVYRVLGILCCRVRPIAGISALNCPFRQACKVGKFCNNGPIGWYHLTNLIQIMGAREFLLDEDKDGFEHLFGSLLGKPARVPTCHTTVSKELVGSDKVFLSAAQSPQCFHP